MHEPRAERDARFSDPGTTATPWAETRAVLESAQLFWISTVRADGRPHVTPLLAVWQDGKAHVCTGPREQKAVNLAGNPHVALTTGCNGWEGGLDVVVEGVAHRVVRRAALEPLADAWATKWDGSWRFEATDGGFEDRDGHGPVLMFAVVPTKILAFAKSPFVHTRYLPVP